MKTIALIIALTFSGSLMAQNGTLASGMEKPVVEKLNNGTIKATYYYENGNVRETGYFLNGQKHGTWVSFDEKGNKQMEANWKNGEKDGNWTVWHENGTLHYLMVYEGGKRVVSTKWDSNGALIAGNQTR
ncbi:MAG TPA: membrane-binding protein [Flavobacteriales bacterium]|nr:membrane-binding protein [Flavobacteriales bacterium]HRE95433.1 membrane-binding protein [Flavobacteriales bacterium]HRJ34647.1 membrane-binding protein [Flavobacteriales bacterium]HRJ39506.1 membrane-binding protein [Flavobacteriales bacterium]